MAAPLVGTAFTIPTVTEDDLRAFHHQHYHDAPAPKAFFSESQHGVTADSVTEELVEDDLGYYPDGAPRTLTDAQIELFRHTEIHSILRERRRAHERKLEELEDGEVDAGINDEHQPSQATPSSLAISGSHRELASPTGTAKPSSQTGQVKQNSNRNKKKRKNKSDLDRPNKRPAKKLKWDQYVPDDQDNPGAYTHRRLAREMDQVPAATSSVDLMYDDEEDDEVPTTGRDEPASTERKGRTLTTYGD